MTVSVRAGKKASTEERERTTNRNCYVKDRCDFMPFGNKCFFLPQKWSLQESSDTFSLFFDKFK